MGVTSDEREQGVLMEMDIWDRGKYLHGVGRDGWIRYNGAGGEKFDRLICT